MITIEQQMEEYEYSGLIDAECVHCGTWCRTEIDNPKGFCDVCDTIVDVENHIYNQGMI